MLTTTLFCIASSALAASVDYTHRQFDPSGYAKRDVIRKDFAIIGGGAAGTYAAISLADLNHSFTLVELSDELGGHTKTYQDASTGVSLDYGVQTHYDTPLVRNFFERLNSSLTAFQLSDFGKPTYYDFKKQVAVTNYTKGAIGSDYAAILNKYPYLDNLNDLPKKVPADLLLPWPEFAQKINLSVGSIEGGLGWPATPGDPLKTTALAILNDGNHVELAEFSGAGVRNANHDNSLIFRNALAELKPNVLLRSSIIAAQRGETHKSGVRLVVKTPTGNKLIIAKQVVIAMPPVMDNMKYFGLDHQEYSILSKLSGKNYYAGVFNNSGLEAGTAYINVGVDRPYNVSSLPGVVEIAPSATAGYFFYWYNSDCAKTQSEVVEAARRTIQYLQTQTGVYSTEPNFLAYQDYSPFHLSPPNADIADGWYSKMKGLQGHRNTWYTSSLFVVGASQIWNDTQRMLPDIISAAQS